MAEQQEPTVRNVRPTVMVGGGSDTTFVDVRDLHPENEVTATVMGGVGGGVVGSIPAAFVYLSKESEGTLKKAGERLSGAGKGAAIALIVATTAIGATIGFLNARTHNKWSERVTEKTLETQTNHAANPTKTEIS